MPEVRVLSMMSWVPILLAVTTPQVLGCDQRLPHECMLAFDEPQATLIAQASDHSINNSDGRGEIRPDSLGLKNAAIILGGSLAVGYYGMTQWWQDGFSGQFRTRKEGWFGQDTDYGGADKLGHAYFSYATARLMTRAFQTAGNSPRQASRLGAWSSLGVMVGVEVIDGYSKKYRFSGEDAVMNVVGAGLAFAMETYPALDRLIDFRLLYKPSPDSSFDPGGDYSGQTYLMVLKANGLETWREHPVMRYLEFAVGYGSRGYGDTPPADAHRVGYVGISVNLSEVLARTVFRGDRERSRLQRAADVFLDLAQVPGTIVMKGHRF